MLRALLRLLFFGVAAGICWLLLPGRQERKISTLATVESRLQEFGPGAIARLKPRFRGARLPFPPKRLVFIGLKEEKELEVWAAGGARSAWVHIKTYPILAASGGPGPKLREGDLQVPEGFYKIELLNPNSKFHLSLRIGYPNEEDRQNAALENRTNLGGDIMIHGGAVSVGCVAVGDPAAEELFVLAAKTGIKNIEVLLVPHDFRKKPPDQDAANEQSAEQPGWVRELYARLAGALEKYDTNQ